MNARAWARIAGAAVLLAVCLPGWFVGRLVGRGDGWVRRFLQGCGWLLGLRVTIEGQPLPGPALYVANHITFLDIFALGGAVPARFVAKSEIEGWGLFGFLSKVGGTIFIRREQRSATREQADRLVTALGEGRPVVLFGEGATGDGVTLLPFRAPLFVSAGEAGAPVQPVAIDYGPERARLAWPDDIAFVDAGKRMLSRRERVPVTLRFLAPLDARALDRKALAVLSHAAIAGALSP